MKYLLIVDTQNAFITGALGTREAQEAMPALVKESELLPPTQLCCLEVGDFSLTNIYSFRN